MPGATGFCEASGTTWVDPTGTVPLPGDSLRWVNMYAAPHYPDELRGAGVEGAVVATFVVDTTGRVDVRSVRITSSTDPQFSRAVCAAVPRFRFRRADGRPLLFPVRTSAPFTFSIAG